MVGYLILFGNKKGDRSRLNIKLFYLHTGNHTAIS